MCSDRKNDNTCNVVCVIEIFLFSILFIAGEPVNTPPFLLNPVDNISAALGQYFEYHIPSDTFYDLQDGTTENLNLTLLDINQSELTKSFWVQFDRVKQIVFGLPLDVDKSVALHEFVLIAKDSSGLTSERDAIVIKINTETTKDLNHYFHVVLDLPFESFVSETTNVIDGILTIGNFFGEKRASSIVVSNIQNGSVVITWSNGTLSRTVCENDTINSIFDKLSGGGVLNPNFSAALWPKYPVASVSLELAGSCLPLMPVATMPPIVPQPPGTEAEPNILLWTLIPAVVLVLLIFVIAVTLCYIRRKRRYSGKVLMDNERPVFTNDRKPVLLANELQMLDLNNVPKRPVVLNRDLESELDLEPVHPSPAGDSHRPKPPPYYYPDDFDPMLDNLESPPPSYRGSPPEGHSPLFGKNPPEYKLPPPYSAHMNPVFPRRGSSDA